MGGSFQKCRIAKMARYKRRKVTDSIKRDVIFMSSPPASPFNSTAFLIRQRSCQQKEAELPPILGEPELDQYGSNSKDVIACCIFAASNHEQGCDYKSQADHPVIVGLSLQSLARYHSASHLELQAKLPGTDPPQPERNVTLHHRHRSGNHGASSAGTRKLEDLALASAGHETVKHQRMRSVTDDNFNILLSHAATSAKTPGETVIEDIRNNFCALGISEAMRLA